MIDTVRTIPLCAIVLSREYLRYLRRYDTVVVLCYPTTDAIYLAMGCREELRYKLREALARVAG